MRTLIQSDDGDLKVQESYQTLKVKLHNASDFVEVTTEKGKRTISKMRINAISPIEKKKK